MWSTFLLQDLCFFITELQSSHWQSEISLSTDLPTSLNPKPGGSGPKSFSSCKKCFGSLLGGLGAWKFWKLVCWDWLKMRFQHVRHINFRVKNIAVKVLRSSSDSGNWCCLTVRLVEFIVYLEILVMYREDGRISGVPRPNRGSWHFCEYLNFCHFHLLG